MDTSEGIFEGLFNFLDLFPEESDKKQILLNKLRKQDKNINFEEEVESILYLYEQRTRE